jgi:hypothetical protein
LQRGAFHVRQISCRSLRKTGIARIARVKLDQTRRTLLVQQETTDVIRNASAGASASNTGCVRMRKSSRVRW